MHKLMGNIHPELWPLKKWTIIIYFLSFSEISKTSTLVSNLFYPNREKTTGFQIKLKELINLHQIKEASLKNELSDTQKQLKNAVEMCAGTLSGFHQNELF